MKIVKLYRENGIAKMNIPQVVHHSPDGVEWNYGGSGPADCALSVLEWALKESGHEGPRVQVHRGTCFEMAWRLHHAFKWAHIVTLDRPGPHEFSLAEVLAWIHTQSIPESDA